jgi:elongation factor P
VISAEYHTGSGKMGGLVHTKLRRLDTGALVDRKFKPDERLEDVEIERRSLEYLYTDKDGFQFMDPESYEQILIPSYMVKPYEPFLESNMRISVEFCDGEAVNLIFPEFVELTVISTPPPVSTLQDEVFKTATLSNNMEVLVPQFIKEGDVVKIEVASGKYVERIKKG